MDGMPFTSRGRTSRAHGWWLVSALLHAVLLLVIFNGKASVAHGRTGARIIEISLVESPKGIRAGELQEDHDRRQRGPPRRMENHNEAKGAKPVPSGVTIVPSSGRTFLRAVEAIAALSPGVPATEMAGTSYDSEANGTGAESGGSLPPSGEGVTGQAAGGGLFSRQVDTALILSKLEAAKRYPPVARKMGIEGTPVVRFRLEPSGRVEAVEIVKSSGSEILDRAALKNIHDAAPLPYVEGWQKVEIVFKLF